jgi:hypothetical protein
LGVPGAAALLLAWALVPIGFAALSSAQSPRYVFAIFPALALLGGAWLAQRAPRIANGLRRAVPVLLVAGAVVFWVRPEWLSRSTRDPFRDQAAAICARAPEGSAIPYWGGDYWRVANPLLWYADRLLEPSAPSADSAVARGRARAGVLVCDRRRLADLPAGTRSLAEGRDGVVVELPR